MYKRKNEVKNMEILDEELEKIEEALFDLFETIEINCINDVSGIITDYYLHFENGKFVDIVSNSYLQNDHSSDWMYDDNYVYIVSHGGVEVDTIGDWFIRWESVEECLQKFFDLNYCDKFKSLEDFKNYIYNDCLTRYDECELKEYFDDIFYNSWEEYIYDTCYDEFLKYREDCIKMSDGFDDTVSDIMCELKKQLKDKKVEREE